MCKKYHGFCFDIKDVTECCNSIRETNTRNHGKESNNGVEQKIQKKAEKKGTNLMDRRVHRVGANGALQQLIHSTIRCDLRRRQTTTTTSRVVSGPWRLQGVGDEGNLLSVQHVNGERHALEGPEKCPGRHLFSSSAARRAVGRVVWQRGGEGIHT